MPATWKPVLFLSIAILTLAFGLSVMPLTHADEDQGGLIGVAMEPVEADVHEFMEYAFEPFFHQLKKSLAEPPKEKKAWVPVKANSLILAENGNLLMLRGPDEEQAEWNRLAAQLRDQGKLLYAAAKKRDFVASRKQYETFVSKCNACHEKFADGEHIQKP